MGGFVSAYRCSIIVALLFLPLTTSARELALGVEVGADYGRITSSAATRNEGQEPRVRISPTVLLNEYEGDFQWRFRYRSSYQQFLQTTEISRWTHQVHGDLSWQINPTTRLSLSDSFGYFSSVSRFNERVTQGDEDEVVDVTEGFSDKQYIRNRISASLAHNLSPTQNLVFTLGHNLTDRSGSDGAGRQMVRTTGSYTHTVSQRNTFGGGISFRRSFSDSTSARDSQSTDFFNLFARWSHQFDETLALSVSVGPTWVQADDQDGFAQTLENRPLYPVFEDKFLRASSCPTLTSSPRTATSSTKS
jgi:hypothetical protein